MVMEKVGGGFNRVGEAAFGKVCPSSENDPEFVRINDGLGVDRGRILGGGIASKSIFRNVVEAVGIKICGVGLLGSG